MSFTFNLTHEESNSQVDQNGRVVSTYQRTFHYKTDAIFRPTSAQIVADIGIVPGSPYPDDFNATAKKVGIGPGPERTRPPFLCYTVKIEWATNAAIPNTVSTDPTSMRTTWSISPAIQSRYVVKDRHGDMILNAAGQPFDGGVPVDVRLVTAVASRNVAAAGYDKNTVLANSGKLNSAIFLGAAIGTVQVDINAAEKYEGSYHYWQETYTFAYDPLGWQPKPMNAGFFQRTSYGLLLRIINSDVGDTNDPSAPVQEPEPLLMSGAIVPVADRPDDCNFIEVDYFDKMDFNSFGL